MRVTSTTEFRKNLSKMMTDVVDDHVPLIVTRADGKPAVLVSLEDWSAMDETAYLLASPANRTELLEAVERINKGEAKPRELIDPE